MDLKSFIKIFGIEGYSDRFKDCEAKNGDKCTGEYYIDNGTLYFMYTDKKYNDNIYASAEMPVFNTGLEIIRLS